MCQYMLINVYVIVSEKIASRLEHMLLFTKKNNIVKVSSFTEEIPSWLETYSQNLKYDNINTSVKRIYILNKIYISPAKLETSTIYVWINGYIFSCKT